MSELDKILGPDWKNKVRETTEKVAAEDDETCVFGPIESDPITLMLVQAKRSQVLKRVMSGNDAGCFSAEQYRDAYLAQARSECGEATMCAAYSFRDGDGLPMARKHLASMVEWGWLREVRFGVWAPNEVGQWK